MTCGSRKRNALLESGHAAFDEISAERGYENPGFFRRLFRRRTGLTPGQYRRMFQPVALAETHPAAIHDASRKAS